MTSGGSQPVGPGFDASGPSRRRRDTGEVLKRQYVATVERQWYQEIVRMAGSPGLPGLARGGSAAAIALGAP